MLMSGGVDSSVAALLLKRQGLETAGFTLKLPTHGTPADDVLKDAGAVCRELGIPHYEIDLEGIFSAAVIEPFRAAYENGMTPNPCVFCNEVIKFGVAWDLIRGEFGEVRLASGHYARITGRDGRAVLTRAAVRERDQSYFLYRLSPGRLGKVMLPLGELDKSEVRRIAEEASLPVADREDSMELCFVGACGYREFLGRGTSTPGDIVDAAGKVLGRHAGIKNYTVGQRRGLGIAAGEPLYVTAIDPVRNTVTAGPRGSVLERRVKAVSPVVHIAEAFHAGSGLSGKIRSYGEPAACVVREVLEGGGGFEAEFAEACFAPTPGQHLVLYDGEGAVVAGGVIEKPSGRE